jgi:hypothetical protein
LVRWYWRNCWPSLFKLSFGLLILVELLTITVKTSFCFVDIGGIVGHHCLINFPLFCWHWRNCWPSLFKLSYGLLILVELLTITVKAFFCFVDIGGIVGHHCSNFLFVCWYWSNLWPSLLKLSFGLLILVELLTITVKSFFCFVDIGRIIDHHFSNFLLVCWYWRNYWPSLLKLSSGLLILEEFSTITVQTFFWFVDIGRIVEQHC